MNDNQILEMFGAQLRRAAVLKLEVERRDITDENIERAVSDIMAKMIANTLAKMTEGYDSF